MSNITIEEAIRGNEPDDVLAYFKEEPVSANDTAEVYTRGFGNFLVWIKVDGACTITLDAVSPWGEGWDSKYSIDSFVSIAETVKVFTGAGSGIIDLNEIITTKKALKANFLRFKFSAGVTASFAVIGKLANSSLTGITSLPSVSSATPTKKTVGATSTSILAANANRIFATFVNDSNETIYLSLSGVAVMNEGIRLNASGGSYDITLMNLYKGVVTAICASGSKNLTVTEG